MTALLPLLSGLGTGLALIVAIGVQNTYLLRLAVSARLRVVAAAVVVCAVSDAVLIVAGVLGVGAVVERFPVALVVVRFVGAAFLVTYGVLAARRALRPSGDAIRVEEEAADDGVAVVAPAGGHRAPAPAGAMSVAGRDGDVVPTAGVTSGAGRDGAVVPTTVSAGAAGRARTVPPGRRGDVTMRAAVATMLVFTWANPHVYLDTLVFLGSVANQQGVDDRWLWTIGATAASCLWFAGLGFGGRLLRPLFAKPLTWRVFDGLVALVMLGFGAALVLGA
ncbi:L-lysine exporter family protein LysE/ArgO [Curtobacterium flaccumfaciens]|uniref:L-lysine exporter family protein LysE/ArgO n=1 Tax=Curtobacterium flaccumfaciens TaxID=2035 RepID=A0A4R6DKS7_9MICO|nr:LysE family transporter [Curtobacterium flaccumfaciens]TDN45350.1 L-lysine exporter family protein LysE/ArgO [Curtobacterium flaccumfaciens]